MKILDIFWNVQTGIQEHNVRPSQYMVMKLVSCVQSEMYSEHDSPVGYIYYWTLTFPTIGLLQKIAVSLGVEYGNLEVGYLRIFFFYYISIEGAD